MKRGVVGRGDSSVNSPMGGSQSCLPAHSQLSLTTSLTPPNFNPISPQILRNAGLDDISRLIRNLAILNERYLNIAQLKLILGNSGIPKSALPVIFKAFATSMRVTKPRGGNGGGNGKSGGGKGKGPIPLIDLYVDALALIGGIIILGYLNRFDALKYLYRFYHNGDVGPMTFNKFETLIVTSYIGVCSIMSAGKPTPKILRVAANSLFYKLLAGSKTLGISESHFLAILKGESGLLSFFRNQIGERKTPPELIHLLTDGPCIQFLTYNSSFVSEDINDKPELAVPLVESHRFFNPAEKRAARVGYLMSCMGFDPKGFNHQQSSSSMCSSQSSSDGLNSHESPQIEEKPFLNLNNEGSKPVPIINALAGNPDHLKSARAASMIEHSNQSGRDVSFSLNISEIAIPSSKKIDISARSNTIKSDRSPRINQRVSVVEAAADMLEKIEKLPKAPPSLKNISYRRPSTVVSKAIQDALIGNTSAKGFLTKDLFVPQTEEPLRQQSSVAPLCNNSATPGTVSFSVTGANQSVKSAGSVTTESEDDGEDADGEAETHEIVVTKSESSRGEKEFEGIGDSKSHDSWGAGMLTDLFFSKLHSEVKQRPRMGSFCFTEHQHDDTVNTFSPTETRIMDQDGADNKIKIKRQVTRETAARMGTPTELLVVESGDAMKEAKDGLAIRRMLRRSIPQQMIDMPELQSFASAVQFSTDIGQNGLSSLDPINAMAKRLLRPPVEHTDDDEFLDKCFSEGFSNNAQ